MEYLSDNFGGQVLSPDNALRKRARDREGERKKLRQN
jgi:hypothetical protein